VKPYYADDSVTLYHGDCLTVMPELEPASFALVASDLPYGMTDAAWDSTLPIDRLWAEWNRLTPKDGAVVLTASQPFTSALVASNFKGFRTEWIWEKNAGSNFGTVKRQPMKEHESVLLFSRGRYTYNPIMQERSGGGLDRVRSGPVNYATKAEVYQSGGLLGTATSTRPDLRYPRSIQRFNRERGLHPTQKPVGLFKYLIETYSLPGDVVLDPCAGSGTTGVAARDAGRRSVLIELDERYCEVIAGRFANTLSSRAGDS
jgi:site-specific DNA-methyltransferase (adenine-specific)